MFDKIKQMNELRKMQNALKDQRSEVEKNGVKVAINGKMELIHLRLNPELDTKKQEQLVKECFNEAVKKLQQELMKNMSMFQ